MATVMLAERVAALRVRRRLGHAVPADGPRLRRAVPALRSRVVGARGPLPSFAATDVLHLEKRACP